MLAGARELELDVLRGPRGRLNLYVLRLSEPTEIGRASCRERV